jgi:SAM-dependent methyltransferase
MTSESSSKKAILNHQPATSDWATTRGDKWSARLSGMEAMLMPVDEPLFHALQLEGPARIAEVGCGGGGTAMELLQRAPTGSVVHGFDISPTLIELARRRTPPNAPIAFDVADMATAAPENPYDRLFSRFGVMFFDDAQAAFENLARWLAPGGRFAFAVWGPTSDNPWMTSVRDVAARFVELPKADPQAPGPFRYGDTDALVALLDRAGFSQLAVRDWRGTLPIGGKLPAAEAAHFALASFSTFGELLTEAGNDAFDEARRSLTTIFSQHHRDDAVRMDAHVHIVTGTRR